MLSPSAVLSFLHNGYYKLHLQQYDKKICDVNLKRRVILEWSAHFIKNRDVTLQTSAETFVETHDGGSQVTLPSCQQWASSYPAKQGLGPENWEHVNIVKTVRLPKIWHRTEPCFLMFKKEIFLFFYNIVCSNICRLHVKAFKCLLAKIVNVIQCFTPFCAHVPNKNSFSTVKVHLSYCAICIGTTNQAKKNIILYIIWKISYDILAISPSPNSNTNWTKPSHIQYAYYRSHNSFKAITQ